MKSDLFSIFVSRCYFVILFRFYRIIQTMMASTFLLQTRRFSTSQISTHDDNVKMGNKKIFYFLNGVCWTSIRCFFWWNIYIKHHFNWVICFKEEWVFSCIQNLRCVESVWANRWHFRFKWIGPLVVIRRRSWGKWRIWSQCNASFVTT